MSGFKGSLVVDAAGVPTGVAGVVPSTLMDGIKHALPFLAGDNTFVVGTDKDLGAAITHVAVALGESMYIGNGWQFWKRA